VSAMVARAPSTPLWPLIPSDVLPQTPRYNPFDFNKKLGDGASSEVFLSSAPDGRYMAIKRIRTEDLVERRCPYADGSFNPRRDALEAKAELDTSAVLQHPHIVRATGMYEAFDSEEKLRWHVVLEFVDGSVVGKIQPGSYSQQQTLHNVRAFLGALSFSLQRGFVYVDAKVENVMIDHQGEIKLVDLGGFDTLAGPGCQMIAIGDWLNDVLDVCDGLLRTGRWEPGELGRVDQGLSVALRSSRVAAKRENKISEVSQSLLIDCLRDFETAISRF
jgi:serine/threonine protein kinase